MRAYRNSLLHSSCLFESVSGSASVPYLLVAFEMWKKVALSAAWLSDGAPLAGNVAMATRQVTSIAPPTAAFVLNEIVRLVIESSR